MRLSAPLLAAVAALGLSASPARAEDPALLGMFEGHGVARPADAKAARAAERAVNRVLDLCYSYWGAGFEINGTDERACDAAAKEVENKRVDAAPFILDALEFGEVDGAWRYRLLGSLARSGREDVVPALVRALERHVARTPSRLGEEYRYISLSDLTDALEWITHAAPADMAPWKKELAPKEKAEAWRAWLAKNGGKKRAEWLKESQADFERRADLADEAEAFVGVQNLCARKETRASGKQKLAAFLARSGLSPEARSAGEELAKRVADAEKKKGGAKR
jgi:hypothetical protein